MSWEKWGGQALQVTFSIKIHGIIWYSSFTSSHWSPVIAWSYYPCLFNSMLFLTCQVRVVRLYVSCLPPPPPPPPQPPAPDGSVPRRTSTASFGWQRSAGPQPAHNHNHTITNTTTNTITNTQTQSQTHSHKHNHNTQPQHATKKTHLQHTTTTHNYDHSTQPEDVQTKSRTTKLTTMARCSSPWHEDK